MMNTRVFKEKILYGVFSISAQSLQCDSVVHVHAVRPGFGKEGPQGEGEHNNDYSYCEKKHFFEKKKKNFTSGREILPGPAPTPHSREERSTLPESDVSLGFEACTHVRHLHTLFLSHLSIALHQISQQSFTIVESIKVRKMQPIANPTICPFVQSLKGMNSSII
jgi:hypothetical protein